MTFRTFSAAESYLKSIGKPGYIETRNYSGSGKPPFSVPVNTKTEKSKATERGRTK